MAIFDPVFCRQIFQVDPDRRTLAHGHRREVRRGKAAAESFDHDRGWVGKGYAGPRPAPAAQLDVLDTLRVARRVDAGREAGQRGKRVDEQAHGKRVLGRELTCEAPGDAQEDAVVVDEGAEDVPALEWGRHRVLLTPVRLNCILP